MLAVLALVIIVVAFLVNALVIGRAPVTMPSVPFFLQAVKMVILP